MIIEIGTSDFRTKAGQEEGIFIEPVKYYFDRLPDCTKENVAISNKTGEIKIYYLTDIEIDKYDLPNWVRGCNSINNLHPSVKDILDLKGLPYSLFNCDTVKVVRIKSIINKYNIEDIDLLKVDTEGHDTIIVNDFLDTVDFLPYQIQFESNVLSNMEDVVDLAYRLECLGYKIEHLPNDILATL